MHDVLRLQPLASGLNVVGFNTRKKAYCIEPELNGLSLFITTRLSTKSRNHVQRQKHCLIDHGCLGFPFPGPLGRRSSSNSLILDLVRTRSESDA